jgi:hypothetical protein
MKKTILIIALVFLGLNSIKAQDVKGIIKVNPLGFAVGFLNATYEKPLNEKNSFAIGANYYNYSSVKISGLGLSGEYRFYFSNNSTAPEGLFGAPIVNLSSLSYDGTNGTETVFSFGAGVKGGYQWVWDSGVALDLYFGYGFRSAQFDTYNYTGGYPILGLAIGYAFQ